VRFISQPYLADEMDRLLQVFSIFWLNLEDGVNYLQNLCPVVSAIKHTDVQNHRNGEHIIVIYQIAEVLWRDKLCLKTHGYSITNIMLIWLVYFHITRIFCKIINVYRILVGKLPLRTLAYR
jgi:hypothetical protein